MLPEVPDVDAALDTLRRDATAVSHTARLLRTEADLPRYSEDLEARIAARNAAMLAAAAAGASLRQMSHALGGPSGQRTRQMLDQAPVHESARQEALHEWGVGLRHRRVAANLNRGQLAALSLMSRAEVIALEDGEQMPAPQQTELLRAALTMSPLNRAARMRVIREQQVGPRPLPQTGGPRRGPLNPEQQTQLDAVRRVLTKLQPLLDERDALLAAAQEAGVPMSRLASETGLTPAEVRRSVDAVHRRTASTQAG